MDVVRSNLKLLFSAAVKAVQPHNLIPSTLTRKGNSLSIDGKSYVLNRNCYVAAFGKAASGMATAVESVVGEHLIRGVVSVPRGIQTLPATSFTTSKQGVASKLEIFEGAAGNLPDSDSVRAAETILSMVTKLDDTALLIVLISGGGSALLPLPREGISLDEKLAVIKLLVENAATIVELNCVRKKLSRVKGGGLAVASYPTKTLTLILSDVIGDPIESIASGPTSPNADHMTASSVIEKYRLENVIPTNVLDALAKESIDMTKIPINEKSFCHVDNVLIGNNGLALRAVSLEAEKLGYIPVVLSSCIQGIAKETGSHFAKLADSICQGLSTGLDREECSRMLANLSSLNAHGQKGEDELFRAFQACKQSRRGLCLIFGGETTVEVKGNGIGGRNQELALSFAVCLQKLREASCGCKFHVALMSAGTDGIDGPTPAAGAIAYWQQIQTARKQSLDPEDFLRDNDSHSFYAKLGNGDDLVVSGHTGTNVMDVIVLIIQPS